MSDKGYTDYSLTARVPDGLKFSNSLQNPEAVSPLLRNINTNELETHAQLILEGRSEEGMKKVVEAIKDLSPGTKVIILAGAVVVVGGAVVIGRNWDSIKKIGERAFGMVRPKRAIISKTSELDAIEIDIRTPSTEVEQSDRATVIEILDEETEIVLSLDEWRQLFQSALALSSFEEQVWLLLSRVTIEAGDDRTLTWQRQMQELPKEEFLQLVRESIESAPQQQDDQAVAEVMKMLIRRLGRGEDEQKYLE